MLMNAQLTVVVVDVISSGILSTKALPIALWYCQNMSARSTMRKRTIYTSNWAHASVRNQ